MCDVHNDSCGIHGICSINNTCVCSLHWVTVNANMPCSYARYDQVMLVAIHILFGYTGVSAFVIGWFEYGLLLITSCMFACSISIHMYTHERRGDLHVPHVWIVLYIATIMVHIITYVVVLALLIYHCVDTMGVHCAKY